MRFLIFVATVAHMAIISGATLTGQVIPDEGISIESTIVNLYENDWSNTVLSSASIDTSGNFSLDCDGSCSVAAQQMSEGALVALSHRIQVPSNKSHVRLQLSAKRTITVHASVPETENYRLTYTDLDTLDEINRGTGLNAKVNATDSLTVPAGRYRISLILTAYPDAPERAYYTSVGVDVSDSSTSVSLPAKSFPGDRKFLREPPDSSLISVSQPDENGRARVVGQPGAAKGLMLIGLMNMQTGVMTNGSSASDGSFDIKVFAPLGSSIMVTQATDAWTFKYEFSAAPGTVVYSDPEDPLAINTGQRLNGGAKNGNSGLKKLGGTDAGFVWISGQLDDNQWSAGSSGTLSGTGIVYSRNIKDANPTLSSGTAYLEMIFDNMGRQTAAGPENSSSDMTPTGFPIDRSEPIYQESILVGFLKFSGLKILSDSTASFSWSLEYVVPKNSPDGLYNLVLTGQGWSMNPWVNGLDKATLYYDDVYGEPSFHLSTVHAAAQVTIGESDKPRLFAALLLNDLSNGSRGVTSVEDKELFGISGHIVTNSDRFVTSLNVGKTTAERMLNLEPFIPLTGFSNKAWMGPPKTLFKFPSGNLSISIKYPDDSTSSLGSAPFRGAYLQKATSFEGEFYNSNSNAPDSHFGLTTGYEAFNVTFDQYGKHTVSIDGYIEDIYGRSYDISGNYEVYVAETLDLEFGTFPSTPFEVGDSFSPGVIVQPGIPADVEIKIKHLPNSDSTLAELETISGTANRFGYYMPKSGEGFKFLSAGEYRVDYNVSYKDANETLWMGSRSWGSVVETSGSPIVTHGGRGSESNKEVRQWYNMEDTNDDQNAHFFLPYQTGDIAWMDNFTTWNAAMTNIATLEDASGTISSLGRAQEALEEGEMVLRSSSEFSHVPPFLIPEYDSNHWGYYYSGVGRPGVSVREFVGTQQSSNGYWRFDTPYNLQLGNGTKGDRVNDFKFMFGGAVYRAPSNDFSYYGAYGSLWVMLPEEDPTGGRIMPPFQAAANGPSGGPIMTLKGAEVDIFYHPQGVRPGSILEIGDTASFSGQVAPTLPSDVSIKITTPSGIQKTISGQANKVGYFYDPALDFEIEEPGVYDVDVLVTHTGLTSAGQVEPPFPSGGILGGNGKSFKFYAVTKESKTAQLKSPNLTKLPNSLELNFELGSKNGNEMTGMYQTTVMPGFLLEHSSGTSMQYAYNATELNKSFPNLDLASGASVKTNGSDTVTFSFLLSGKNSAGDTVYEARQILLQGEKLYSLDNEIALEGVMSLSLEGSELTAGDTLKVDLSFSGKGLADIYVALILPDGSFLTIGNPLVVSGIGEIIPFKKSVSFEQLSSINIVDVVLPEGLAKGTYQFYAIAVDEDENVFDQKNWESTSIKNWTHK
jgi:hypothetical protein